MIRYRPDDLGQAILYTLPRKVQRFRLTHAWVLIGLGFALIGAVVCQEQWAGFPHWPVYALTGLLVFDALLHAWIDWGYAVGEMEAWRQVLALAGSVQHQARIEAAVRHKPPKKPTKGLYGPRPPFRVVRPDEEPPGRS